MKLINLVCPNCGASLSQDENKEKCTCSFCGAELLIDNEEVTINIKGGYEFGYEAEKGRQDAEKEYVKKKSRVNYKPYLISSLKVIAFTVLSLFVAYFLLDIILNPAINMGIVVALVLLNLVTDGYIESNFGVLAFVALCILEIIC